VDSPLLKLFCSYSHRDAELCNLLVTHLRGLEQDRLIKIWFDAELRPADDWKGKLSDNIDTADAVLLLISPNFFRSHYCNLEMERALQRSAREGVPVLRLMLEPFKIPARLANLQSFLGDKPVSTFPNPGEAFFQVADKLASFAREYSGDDTADRLAHPDRKQLQLLLHFLCDRGPQREALVRALHPSKRKPRRPFVIVMQGTAADAHSWYLDRLEKELLPQFLPELQGAKAERLTPLPWPNYDAKLTPSDLFTSNLAYCLDRPYDTIDEINDALRLSSTANLLPSTLLGHSWGKHGHKLFNSYLQLWRDWPALPEQRLLFPTVAVHFGDDAETNSRIQRYLKSVEFSGDGVVLPPFPAVHRADLEDWIQHKRVRPYFPAPAAAIQRLDIVFREASAHPMQTLADVHFPRFLYHL
jgi:hypothetical protein